MGDVSGLIHTLLTNNKRFSESTVVRILDDARAFYEKRDNVTTITGRKHPIFLKAPPIKATAIEEVFVVGDLHGSLRDLASALYTCGVHYDDKKDDIRVVFNGDFVDRGSESVEVMCLLLLLSMNFPKNFKEST